MPLISVIIPVFNVEKYLENCVVSVQKQSITDIEIILINDGSKDKSGNIADKLAKSDNRIKVIHNENAGPSSARNAGIENATGDFISFIDSDDWIESNFLEEMYLQAIHNKADIANTGITVDYIKEKKNEKISYPKKYYCVDKNQIGLFFWELHKLKLSNYPVTRLFKRALLLENDIKFDKNLSVGEDLVFNLEAFKYANCVCINNLSPYHYMKRELSTLTSSYNPNYTNAIQIQINAYKDFFSYYSLQDQVYSDFLEQFYLKAHIGKVNNLFKRNSPHNFKSRVKLIRNEIFNNGELMKKIYQIKQSDIHGKIFRYILLSKSPVLIELTYRILFFLRNNFEYLYLKLRPLIRKFS